jgi:hypothetical protein
VLRDNVLLPAPAVRLTALGMLAEGPRRYAELAREVALAGKRFGEIAATPRA